MLIGAVAQIDSALHHGTQATITLLFDRSAPGEMVARSLRISNRKLGETTGWGPSYSSAREGWREVTREIQHSEARLGDDEVSNEPANSARQIAKLVIGDHASMTNGSTSTN